MSNTSATPHSDKVVGHKFFGPDFSLDVFKGTQAANWMKRLFPNLIVAILGADTGESDALSPGGRSPRTPQTPATGKETSDKKFSSLRRILDQSRQLVMQLFQEHEFFPVNSGYQLVPGNPGNLLMSFPIIRFRLPRVHPEKWNCNDCIFFVLI